MPSSSDQRLLLASMSRTTMATWITFFSPGSRYFPCAEALFTGYIITNAATTKNPQNARISLCPFWNCLFRRRIIRRRPLARSSKDADTSTFPCMPGQFLVVLDSH